MANKGTTISSIPGDIVDPDGIVEDPSQTT